MIRTFLSVDYKMLIFSKINSSMIKLKINDLLKNIIFTDINECEQQGICPRPGKCINTLGSFQCICPRGFKLDHTGRFCTDHNECADDASCEHGCQVA